MRLGAELWILQNRLCSGSGVVARAGSWIMDSQAGRRCRMDRHLTRIDRHIHMTMEVGVMALYATQAQLQTHTQYLVQVGSAEQCACLC